MDAGAKDLLFRLLNTPAPSGAEGPLLDVVVDAVGGLADSVETDLHGNLILGLNTRADRRVMLAGHADQIGFMVLRITPEGFLAVEPVGGVDEGVVLGSRVVVHTAGGPVEGVVGKKAVHLQSQQESTTVPTINNVWVDIGARDRDEAAERVKPGDYITYKPLITELLNGRVCAPALDNRAGLFAVLEAFRRCAEADLSVALYAVCTAQEEVGARGAATAAAALRPEVGVAVDVTFAIDDDPATRGKAVAACVLGGGPCISHGPNTNPVVEQQLKDAAGRAGVAYQPSPTGKLEGNDAKAIQAAASGVAAAAVSIPSRNMHTPAEVCCLADLDAAARLLAAFVTGVRPDDDFRPFRPAAPARPRSRARG